MTTREEMQAVFEAVLFASPEPVSATRLLEIFPASREADAQEALEAVLERFRAREPEDDLPSTRGVILDEVAGGLRLATRPDLHGYLRKFFELSSRSRLSIAALETLSIIAYRQPTTGPEINELRGKNSSGVIKTLLERHLIRISGRKEVVGSPFLYATTREFLLHFGLGSLKDLPPLEEFEETFITGGGDEREPSEDQAIQESLALEDTEETVLKELAQAEDRENDEAGPEDDEAAEDADEEASASPDAGPTPEAGEAAELPSPERVVESRGVPDPTAEGSETDSHPEAAESQADRSAALAAGEEEVEE